MGIYDNPETKLPHVFFLSFLDTIARYRSLKGNNSYFPGKVYNFFGRKGDALFPDVKTYEELYSSLTVRNTNLVQSDILRDNLHLSSLEFIADSDSDIVTNVMKDFVDLSDKGYLIENNGVWSLDVQKIATQHDLDRIIENIVCHPTRIKEELHRFSKYNLNPLPITKPTKYSPKNPLGGENIGPLFVLANMWDHKFPDSTFVMTGGNKTLLKYTFLRLLSRTALTGSSGISEVIVWPRLYFDDNIQSIDLQNIIKSPKEIDALRLFLSSSYSNRLEKIHVTDSRYKFTKRMINLMYNLAIPLKTDFPDSDFYFDKTYIKYADNLNFVGVLSYVNKEFKELSNQVAKYKQTNTFDIEKKLLLRTRYRNLVWQLSPFIPYISNDLLANY